MGNRAPYRTMAVVFAAATAFSVAVFVARLAEREVRTGLAFVAITTGASAVGLWMRARWGRSLAILVTLANAGVGTLILLAAILDRSPALGPAVYLAVNVAAAFALTRSWFGLPSDRP